MRPALTGLWRHPNFLRLWAGESVSLLGSQVTLLALPLTAVLTLHATPVEMGFLRAVQYAPFLLIGLFAGVWADRLRRRPLMIAADLGRTAFLCIIPAAAWLGQLRIELLYAVGFSTGILRVFFDVSYQAFLPALVDSEDLVDGNSKLEVSDSIARVAGPGLAGVLVQILSAATAILIDAVSFLVSALCLSLIRVREVVPAVASRRNIWVEMHEGLRIVVGNPTLRGIAGCTSTANLFGSVIQPLFLLYAVRRLQLTPGILGLVIGAGGIGALAGALAASRLVRRLGLGPTIIGAMALGSSSWLMLPAVHGSRAVTAPLLGAAWFVIGMTGVIYDINQVSLRQVLTPDRLQGRMNATMRFLVWGTIPLGALLGGALAERLGLRPTLVIGACGAMLCVPWLVFSPVRRLRAIEPGYAS